MATLFEVGELITNSADLYLRWDDLLDAGIYTDVHTEKEYCIPREIMEKLDENLSDNSLMIFVRKESIVGEIVALYSRKSNKPLQKAIRTPTYMAYYTVKIVTILPLHNYYIILPLISMKKYNLS